MIGRGAVCGALTALALLTAVSSPAFAAEPSASTFWMTTASAGGDDAGMEPLPAAAADEGGWEKPIPVSFSVDYTLVSNYIWRGINFSEFPEEHGQGVNQQLTLGVEFDLGKFGAVGYTAWFEWYEYQTNRNFHDTATGRLQEVDHVVYYSYDWTKMDERIPVTTTIGWTAYIFPQEYRSDDLYYTNEGFLSIELDDAALFGDNWFALNPSATCYWDFDDWGGRYWEFGISHDFARGDCECLANVPVLKDITVTPSLTLGMDGHFFDIPDLGREARWGSLLYRLDVSYDVSSAFKLPEQVGSFYVTGFLAFSQPLSKTLERELMDDEFFGGVSVGWEW